jgi:hypothetical protein
MSVHALFLVAECSHMSDYDVSSILIPHIGKYFRVTDKWSTAWRMLGLRMEEEAYRFGG